MSTQQPSTGPVGPDTLITVKVLIDGLNRRFKLPLRDLGANNLPQKLRLLLAVPLDCAVRFDRFSDSAGAYVTLDSANPAVYKQLYRAARAKLKLRLRATVTSSVEREGPQVMLQQEPENPMSVEPSRHVGLPFRPNSYLETVLSPVPAAEEVTANFQSTSNVQCTIPAAKEFPARKTCAIDFSRPTLPSLADFNNAFTIDCNSCNKSVSNEHYHCDTCARGDYDLCQKCIDEGFWCLDEDHWLIKRTIEQGRVVASTTKRHAPNTVVKETLKATQQAETVPALEEEERTCNACIRQLPAPSFVTCKDCPDFDLCHACFKQSEHGHHPGHVFESAKKGEWLPNQIVKLCPAGRGVHHDAICDGCDKHIYGVRHKCLTCPDFDYCSECAKSAGETHINHRFVPVYEQLRPVRDQFKKEIHRGIFCDGPLCAKKTGTYIRGDRYKCTVCHDTDFCSNCEASPSMVHNKTHPLIKIKTPIRFVSVDTIHEPEGVTFGARRSARHASTETCKAPSANAATQVQTVAEVKPTESEPVKPVLQTQVDEKPGVPSILQAHFESDSTPDGSTFGPERKVSQSWTLRNGGTRAWPAGCAVHFTGGDDMRNLDMFNPSSVSDMTLANRSNVLDKSLEPGQTAVFTVLLKSPAREGRAISYWRLKTPDGMPFGHKLWVDITVSKAIVTSEKSESVPVPMPFKLDQSVPKSESSSTMIFPQLEKESPESSTHDITKEPSVSTATETIVGSEGSDLADDLESLELDEKDSEDEGFLTDEEYDILDADDEDFLDEV